MSAIQNPEPTLLAPEEGKRIAPKPGAAILFKAWGKRDPGDYELAEFFMAAGHEGPKPHVHRTHEELFYVLQGDVEFLAGQQSTQLGPGSALFVPPGSVHAFRNCGTGDARFLLVVSPSGLHRYFQEIAEMNTAGTLSPAAMTELRLKYDTEEVDVAWAAGKDLI